MTMLYAIDFGVNDALAIHGPDGPVSRKLIRLPRVKGGRTGAMLFPMVVEALMTGNEALPAGDVVVESATLGSSGCEPEDMVRCLEKFPERSLFTVTTRAVKNYRKDNKLKWSKGGRYAKDGDAPAEVTLEEQAAVHAEDAELIWRLATETSNRLFRWTGSAEPCSRVHTSVRPMDQRGYRDERAEGFMGLLPRFEALPEELREVLGNGKGDYARAMVMPFAMASTEPYLREGPPGEMRRRYEKLVGLYDRGYPSFYRRATVVWMQSVARRLAGVTKFEDVTREERKKAWKITQRQIRRFFHLTMDTDNAAKATAYS